MFGQHHKSFPQRNMWEITIEKQKRDNMGKSKNRKVPDTSSTIRGRNETFDTVIIPTFRRNVRPRRFSSLFYSATRSLYPSLPTQLRYLLMYSPRKCASAQTDSGHSRKRIVCVRTFPLYPEYTVITKSSITRFWHSSTAWSSLYLNISKAWFWVIVSSASVDRDITTRIAVRCTSRVATCDCNLTTLLEWSGNSCILRSRASIFVSSSVVLRWSFSIFWCSSFTSLVSCWSKSTYSLLENGAEHQSSESSSPIALQRYFSTRMESSAGDLQQFLVQ